MPVVNFSYLKKLVDACHSERQNGAGLLIRQAKRLVPLALSNGARIRLVSDHECAVKWELDIFCS
jgi:hypothetical protein